MQRAFREFFHHKTLSISALLEPYWAFYTYQRSGNCLKLPGSICLLVHYENQAQTSKPSPDIYISETISYILSKLDSQKRTLQICLKFSPLLPYLLDTLYCAVVNFPVSGSCTVARLSYEKKKEKGQRLTLQQAIGLCSLFLFCQATGDWKDSDWSAWRVMGRISKTFRKVAEEQPLLSQEKMADGI